MPGGWGVYINGARGSKHTKKKSRFSVHSPASTEKDELKFSYSGTLKPMIGWRFRHL